MTTNRKSPELDDTEAYADDERLLRMEERWRTRFERFTAPEPSREDTFRLIAAIKEIGREQSQQPAALEERCLEPSELSEMAAPVWLTETAEAAAIKATEAIEVTPTEASEGLFLRAFNLLRSQWNFYGLRSWIMTCIAVGATGYLAYTKHAAPNASDSLLLWIFGLTLAAIGGISAAFRPRDEGTMILQQLGKYSLLEQTLTRFLLVTCFQLVVAFPISLLLYKEEFGIPLAAFLTGWMAPVLFTAVCGFVLNQWLGMWPSAVFLLAVWSLSLAGSGHLDWLNGLADMESPYFMGIRAVMLMLAALLLTGYALGQRKRGENR